MLVSTEPFGTLDDGREVRRHHLDSGSGLRATVMDHGAAITSVIVPDRRGTPDNVVLAFPDLAGYVASGPYFGATCGRYANRIAGARFELDGVTHQLSGNEINGNHLHGGAVGFDSVLWTATPVPEREGRIGVAFQYVSPDGEQGYPGAVTVMTTYLVTCGNELIIDYRATSTAATPINLTNHAYWNLAGTSPGRDVLDHRLTLHCDRYLPVDGAMIPTGELADVTGTAMDFRRGKSLGEEIAQLGDGFDCCLVVDRSDGQTPGEGQRLPVARVEHPASGRVMEVFSTEIAVQLYTGNGLDGQPHSGGFDRYHGVCLECSHFPDAPNQPDFPGTILRPGATYRQTTVHRFSVMA